MMTNLPVYILPLPSPPDIQSFLVQKLSKIPCKSPQTTVSLFPLNHKKVFYFPLTYPPRICLHLHALCSYLIICKDGGGGRELA
jgi:hypothetical protein